jgi:uncharacterized protein (TIRG00374 family)
VKPALRILGSVAFATLLLVLLMRWSGVGPEDAWRAVERLPASIYVIALAMHLTTYALRALRFQVLLPREHRPGFRRMLAISAAHNMAQYVLPAKTGEAALVVYLRAQCRVPASAGLASLVVSRFLDGAMLCIGTAVACLWLQASGRYGSIHWLVTTSLAMAVVAALFVALSLRGDLLVRPFEVLLRWLRLHRLSFGERILARTNDMALALRLAGQGPRLALAILISLPLWTSIYAFFGLLAIEMGLPEPVSWGETTFATSLGMLCNILPLNGGAGLGTQELGWVTALNRVLGIDREIATATGLGAHLVQLFNIVAMGFLAHLAMGVMPRLRYEER